MNLVIVSLSIGKKYKINLIFMLISICIFSFLSMIIFTIKSYYLSYHSVSFGFIPEVYVEFHRLLTESEINCVEADLKERFSIPFSRKGHLLRKKNVYFSSDDGGAIEKDIAVVGIRYSGDPRITLIQAQEEIQCEVLNIDYFGYWTIIIKQNEKLKEGKCLLPIDEKKTVELRVTDSGEFLELDFVEALESKKNSKVSQKQQLFYSFLDDFLKRFTNLNFSGINIDRFVRNDSSSNERNEFDTYQKPKVIAYTGLICWKSYDRAPVLLSENLTRYISELRGVAKLNMKASDFEYNTWVLDALNFTPQKHLDKYLMLTSYGALRKYFGAPEGFNVLYLYADAGDTKSILSYLRNQYPDVYCLGKSQVIPEFGMQKVYVNIFLFFFGGLLFLLMISVIWVNLSNFYHLFKSELLVLKLHGSIFPLYTLFIAVIILIGHSLGCGLLKFFMSIINDILIRYFYPPVIFSSETFIAATITFTGGLGVTSLIEYRERKKISVIDSGEK